jgi:hypothetical protein
VERGERGLVGARGGVAEAHGRHRGLGGRYEVGVGGGEVVEASGEGDVGLHPPADLAGAVALQRGPHLQGAEAARLLEPVHVVVVALARLVRPVGEVGRGDAEGGREPRLVVHQDRPHVEGGVEPLVRVDHDGVGERQVLEEAAVLRG